MSASRSTSSGVRYARARARCRCSPSGTPGGHRDRTDARAWPEAVPPRPTASAVPRAFVEEHDELVAAEARKRLPRGVAEPMCPPRCRWTGASPRGAAPPSAAAVPRIVAEAVVHDLESIEVEEQHGELARRVATMPRERPRDLIDQMHAIAQAGEAVGAFVRASPPPAPALPRCARDTRGTRNRSGAADPRRAARPDTPSIDEPGAEADKPGRDEIARRADEKVLVPDLDDPLPGR